MDELLQDFLAESAENIDACAAQLVDFESDPSNPDAIADIFRLLHTIKGTCGFLDLPRLERLTHAAESLIGRVRQEGIAAPHVVTLILEAIDRVRVILAGIQAEGVEPAGADADLIARLEVAAGRSGDARSALEEQTRDTSSAAEIRDAPPARTPYQEAASIRVSVHSLERIMRLVSELVLTRNQLLDAASHHANARIDPPLQRLSALTSDLQDGVMRARMQPIGRIFSKLPRLVRDLGAELGKNIHLTIEGADTELDRQLIDLLSDPLTHIIRNCADHGLENSSQRIAAGKPATGRIHVRAWHEAGSLIVEIGDDGRGLDVDKIRSAALQKGLVGAEALAAMKEAEIFRLIMAPGFSTAAAVTNISGRGIGLDVVASNVARVGGIIELASTRGAGARFTLRLPLTLAIAPALVVRCAGQRFALPQQSVVEAISTHQNGASRLTRAGGALFAQLRGEVVPIVDLRAVLRLEALDDALSFNGLIVLMRTGAGSYGLLIDEVSDVQEIVVKPTDKTLSSIGAYAGSTILGDGAVVLILDPSGLADLSGLDNVSGGQPEINRPATHGPSNTSLLLFRAGDGPQKAIPLSLVSRIVMAKSDSIVRVESGLAHNYCGKLMPVIPLVDMASEPDRDEWAIMIVGVSGEPMGLVVSSIVDMVSERLEIDVAGGSRRILGSCLIRGETTEVIDLAHYMELARPEAFQRRHSRKFAVLLVDDREFFREMLRPVLAAAGYDVIVAHGARQAFTMAREGAVFDVVLTDIEMPDMDGYGLAAALREDLRLQVPIIGMDSYAGAGVSQTASAVGIGAVVGKFDRRGLIGALNAALQERPFKEHALEQRVRKEIAA